VSRRWFSLLAGLSVSVALVACGGGDGDDAAGGGSSTTASTGPASTGPASTGPATEAATTSTTASPIEGVQTFSVQAAHSDAPVFYPQVPPVGGTHNPVWQQCTFYSEPVQNEKAVHSLEHGAIWITYRPDVPAADVDTLAALARSRKDVLVSRWDTGLPSPVVVTAWGRQLRLDSVGDPRLAQFVRLYANQGPEMNAPC
jgi:hypothetical protein